MGNEVFQVQTVSWCCHSELLQTECLNADVTSLCENKAEGERRNGDSDDDNLYNNNPFVVYNLAAPSLHPICSAAKRWMCLFVSSLLFEHFSRYVCIFDFDSSFTSSHHLRLTLFALKQQGDAFNDRLGDLKLFYHTFITSWNEISLFILKRRSLACIDDRPEYPECFISSLSFKT